MKNISLFLFTLIIAAALIGGCNTEESPDNPVSGNDIKKLNKPSAELNKELALARSATAKYHDIERARDDGYIDIPVVVQNMGYHLMNGDYTGTFDPGKPALLVYSKNPVTGKMRLVAVEYAVSDENNYPNPPEGFTGNDDVWIHDPDFPLWECHAWVWYNNPDGIFKALNPRVHVDEEDVNYPPES